MPDTQTANWIPNLTGRVDPAVEQAIRYLFGAVYHLRDRSGIALGGPKDKPDTFSLNGFPGVLSQPQKGMAVPYNYKPTSKDIVSIGGGLILYMPTTSIYCYDPSTNPGQFKLVAALGAPL